MNRASFVPFGALIQGFVSLCTIGTPNTDFQNILLKLSIILYFPFSFQLTLFARFIWSAAKKLLHNHTFVFEVSPVRFGIESSVGITEYLIYCFCFEYVCQVQRCLVCFAYCDCKSLVEPW